MTRADFTSEDPDISGVPGGLPVAAAELAAAIAEHAHRAAIILDDHERILWANDGFTRLTGYTLDDVRGRVRSEVLQTSNTDPVRSAEISAAIREGHPLSGVVVRNRHKNGTPLWVRVSGRPLHDDAGRVTAFLATGVDVTAQVERDILERKQTAFDDVQRLARIGSWDYDLATGTQQWSAETFRIHGLPVGEEPDVDSAVTTFVGTDQPALMAAFNACCEKGIPYDIEVRLHLRTGGVRWVRCIGRPCLQDGKIVRVTGTIQDIDEHKRTEQKVIRLAERATLAARFAGIGIWEYDHHTGVLSWDDAMFVLHGMNPDTFSGEFSAWRQVMIPEDRAAEDRIQKAFTEGRGEFDVEYRIRTPAGELRYIRNCGCIVRDPSGKITRSYGVNYDVTRQRAGMIALRESEDNLRKANESLQATVQEARRLALAAEAANQAKSTFIAAVSHEIRTPLNGIIGMTDALASSSLTAEQQVHLNTLKDSGKSLLALINDTLDFAKIEAGHMELERRPFALADCVTAAVDAVLQTARTKHLAFTHLIASDAPPMITGDAVRLRQILINLLGNAVKFTRRGGVRLEVAVEPTATDEAVLVFSVHDTGIGIPADKQARIFDHFFQVDASNTRTSGGTGLGLAISRRFAELMGGDIRVESEPGKGSTFFLRIPAPVAIDDALLQPAGRLARLQGRGVLLIAQGPDLSTLEDRVRDAGMVPSSARDVDTAIDLLAAGRPVDLVVSDPSLQTTGGLEFARRLRDRGIAPCPLLMLDRVGPLSGTATRFHQLMASLISDHTRSAPVPPPAPPALPGEAMPLSILVAEDNPVNQTVVRLALRRLGYEPEVVPDGAEAVAIVRQRAFDLVLMDVQMPRMDGLQATRAIRAQPGHETRPWIIALTAGVSEDDRRKALEAGMNDFLGKPLQAELLRAALGRGWNALQTLTAEDPILCAKLPNAATP